MAQMDRFPIGLLTSNFGKTFRFPCVLVVALGLIILSSCRKRLFNQISDQESDVSSVKSVSFDRRDFLGKYRFEQITPTGERILASAVQWEKEQEKKADLYAQASQSSNNVSRILEMAGLEKYSSPLMMDVLAEIKRAGGPVIELPREKLAVARLIEEYFNGSLPAGALLGSCLHRDCSGQSGDGNLSIVGHVDEKDRLHIWHNNWFRPENRPWREHMIPLNWFQAGYYRKWMSTPWLTRIRSHLGEITDVRLAVPELSELDPAESYVTLAIVPEINAELMQGQSLMSDGLGSIMPFRPPTVKRSEISGPVSPPSPLIDCRKLRTAANSPINVRVEPFGSIICQFGVGIILERIENQGSWTKVRGVCMNGVHASGFLSAALVIPACEQ